MPKINNIGISSETIIKQNHLRKFLSMQIAITKKQSSVMSPYLYFDLNAGNGTNVIPLDITGLSNHIIPGSPAIFLGEACKRSHGLTRILPYFKGFFYEIDADNRQLLNDRYGFCPHLTIAGNHEEAIEHCRKQQEHWKTRGLIYNDENGVGIPWTMIGKISRMLAFKRVDILINYQSTAHKRVRAVHGMQELEMQLAEIDKKRWLIREPHARNQWTFLFGTNWVNFPIWNRAGFFDLSYMSMNS